VCLVPCNRVTLCKSIVHQSSSTANKYVCKNNHENSDWSVMYRINVDCIEVSNPNKSVNMTLFDEGGKELIGCSLEELWEMDPEARKSRLDRLVGYECVAVVSYKHDKKFVITGVLPDVK
jgi:hypothetical protein